VTERLRALEEELRKGRQMLAELDQRRAELRDTLLRISGAIQVLQELSSGERQPAQVLAMTGD
jgi:ABC-type transporter Mla subunit MlaD